MTKIIWMISALVLSVSAFASTPDFSALNQGGPQSKLGYCTRQAWMSARPTMDQNDQANANMAAARAVFEKHQDAIHADMRAMADAWHKYAISKDEVSAAETQMMTGMAPVHTAMMNAQIDTLNLLVPGQRDAFDYTFKMCMRQGY